MLVSARWLSQHLHDKNLVILHIGDKTEYEAGHIPGAQFISLADISKPRGEGLSLELPALEKLKETFERYGISNDSRIVLYFGKDWMSPTSRVYWTLDYLGLSAHSSILNGGMPAWLANGGQLTTVVPTIERGTIVAHVKDILVDGAWVRNHLNKKNIALVDSRDPEFYSGAKPGMMPRAGHIPTAVNLPFSTLADSSHNIKNPEELKALFTAAGIQPGDTVITYCHIGQQATLGYFTARMLGYEAKLYDGSFDEWSRNSDLQVISDIKPETGK